MRVTVLASGSGGNSILVEAGSTRVLIDAGLPAREIAKRVSEEMTFPGEIRVTVLREMRTIEYAR